MVVLIRDAGNDGGNDGRRRNDGPDERRRVMVGHTSDHPEELRVRKGPRATAEGANDDRRRCFAVMNQDRTEAAVTPWEGRKRSSNRHKDQSRGSGGTTGPHGSSSLIGTDGQQTRREMLSQRPQ
jgi:hypothetical protein